MSADDVVLQLRFTTGTLTVRSEPTITLSDTDAFKYGDPYQLAADGITASRALLNGVRILTDTDLDEQGIPRDIRFGWQAAPATANPELSERLAQLLDAIRVEGGVWTGRRARGAYEKVDFWCTDGRGYANLKHLAERGYLKQTAPRKMSYVLVPDAGSPEGTTP